MGRGCSEENESEECCDSSVEDGQPDAANSFLKVQMWNHFSLSTKT